jgi:hypothetical protein
MPPWNEGRWQWKETRRALASSQASSQAARPRLSQPTLAAGEYKIASRSCAGLGLLCLRIRLHVDKQRAARVAPPRPCLVLAP